MDRTTLVVVLLAAAGGAAIAMRLFATWRRTRMVPELAMGLMFLVSGVVAQPLLAATSLDPELFGVLAKPARVLGSFALSFTVACAAFVAWRVMRPSAGWAKLLFALVCVVLAVDVVGRAWFGAEFERPAAKLLNATAMFVAFGWMAIEAALHHRKLRRRLAIGLADPFTTHQILLWALAAGAGALVFATEGLWVVVGGIGPLKYSIATALAGVAGLAIWLAFYPPTFYERWIRRTGALAFASGG